MRVTQSDQVLALLRLELARLRKTQGGRSASPSASEASAKVSAINRMPTLIDDAKLTERQTRRMLIQALLSDQFDELSPNSLQFDALIDEICTLIDQDQAASALLDETLDQLGMAAQR